MSGFDLTDARRLVVKVGSALLVDKNGELNRSWLQDLTLDIAELQRRGCDVLVVSSGAIAIGSAVLGINTRRAKLDDLQAAAAAGQGQLAYAYNAALAEQNIVSAQILLTPQDTENRRRFLNARGTLEKLLSRGVVPIINENDTVATEEIRYGDNDRLAARVAQMVMADYLILLSDVDGFYSADPVSNPNAEHIADVRGITDATLAMAGETRSAIGSGGMATKVRAAQIATRAGCSTVIASGTINRPIRSLETSGRHTVFRADGTPAAARKQWLAGMLEVTGVLTLDHGAANALKRGKSLLPVGIVAIDGEFERGDPVTLRDSDGVELGRGLAEYGADDARKLIGCQSEQIEDRLGYRGRSVVVHRDELVIFDDDGQG